VRYAIITPYYKEERRLLERCIGSVRNQSLRVDHFLVADGFPQDWIDTAGVRHFKLDRSHGDVGNTARGVGALIAIAEEYSAIGMLDADNWLEPDHVEACLAAASTTSTPCDYVVAQRTFRRIDGSAMPIPEDTDHDLARYISNALRQYPIRSESANRSQQGGRLLRSQPDVPHADTSCLFFLRGAFCILPHWAMMPKEMSAWGDRVFYSMLRQWDFVAARVPKPTVNYQMSYAADYLRIGETPPPGAKPDLDIDGPIAWFWSLSRRDYEIASRLIGFTSVDRPPLLATEDRHETSTVISDSKTVCLGYESSLAMQSRYKFHLAQSYRNRGEYQKALLSYLERAELGFWVEEVFLSLYYAAQLQEALGRPFDEVIATYLSAANAVPRRSAEALHGACRYCRLRKRYKEGYEMAKRVDWSRKVPDGLLVESWIYQYGLLDEFAVNAYWAGAYQDCLDTCERILRERKCPDTERPRIEANAVFARQQLGIGNVAGAAHI